MLGQIADADALDAGFGYGKIILYGAAADANRAYQHTCLVDDG